MRASRLAPSLLLLTSLASLACGAPAPAPAQPTPAQPAPAQPTPLDPAGDRHYQSALELEAAGRFVEARAEVDLAIADGAGRDAQLLAAKLAILRDDLDAARRLLTPIARDDDALVLYNLGLIAQRSGQYNEARARYLAALKADPTHAAARYNLAFLTWDAGAKDEAQHHARKFLELTPDAPNAPDLRRKVELDGPPPPAVPAPH